MDHEAEVIPDASTQTWTTRCPSSGEEVAVHPRRVPAADEQDGLSLAYDCPSCGREHQMGILERGPAPDPIPPSRHIDIAFDIDLGELVEGHHVIAKGIELRSDEARLHYDLAPALGNALDERPGFWWYWMVYANDDVGTVYDDANSGAFGNEAEDVSWGERDLGAPIPDAASQLTLRFEPPPEWDPPEPWRRTVVIDLKGKPAGARRLHRPRTNV